jgi:hypothetical protein
MYPSARHIDLYERRILLAMIIQQYDLNGVAEEWEPPTHEA